jgi:predicted O-methyltransferase YrrM
VHLEAVQNRLDELDLPPLTSRAAGRMLYEFVLHSEILDVLELGFAHGMSTAYLAAALDEKGGGLVTTIDRRDALEREPNIHAVLDHVGLRHIVRPVFAERSYTWELMRLLSERVAGDGAAACFDFSFIDGAHTWETDGFAFYLVDALLRDDSWIVFDDLHWRYAMCSTDEGQELPAEERDTPQMKLVFDLLVRRHPSYEGFRVIGNYGWAYKRGGASDSNADAVDRVLRPELVKELAFGTGVETLLGRRTATGD